jgi:hypothetical protein
MLDAWVEIAASGAFIKMAGHQPAFSREIIFLVETKCLTGLTSRESRYSCITIPVNV